MTPKQFAPILLRWFDLHGRKNLPWQTNINPYRVWVSEIMLQQTQVKTVIPYFQRFMQHFPTLADLANAPEEIVLHLWTGLGYYARARHLHHTAKILMSEYHGQLPSTVEVLQTLPGIGRSTAGAIVAIAMQQKAAILDGNVKRVLTRVHAIEGSPTQPAIAEELWKIAEQCTPAQRTAEYTQAIMDLGATVCTRTQPKCPICPIQTHCQAHIQGRETTFPTPKSRKTIPTRATHMLIFQNHRYEVLLEKRPPTGIWGSLWSFPECPADANIHDWCKKNYPCKIKKLEAWPTFKHIFSHFQLNITPIHIQVDQWPHKVMDSSNAVWYKLHNPPARGLASPVKRLLQKLAHSGDF